MQIELIPYHAGLNQEQLADAAEYLKLKKNNVLKIIVATSLADSGVTLPEVKIVLDSGLIKLPELDKPTNVNVLTPWWTNKVLREQRAGRTGRLHDGIYVVFVPKSFQNRIIPTELERTCWNDAYIEILSIKANSIHGRVRFFCK